MVREEDDVLWPDIRAEPFKVPFSIWRGCRVPLESVEGGAMEGRLALLIAGAEFL